MRSRGADQYSVKGSATALPARPLPSLRLPMTRCAGGGSSPSSAAPHSTLLPHPRPSLRQISLLPPRESNAPHHFSSSAAQVSPIHPQATTRRALLASSAEPRLTGASWHGTIWGPTGSITCPTPAFPCRGATLLPSKGAKRSPGASEGGWHCSHPASWGKADRVGQGVLDRRPSAAIY